MFKIAAVSLQSSFKEAAAILGRIYRENPSYWPNGLSAAHFDGGLYLIKEAESLTPVGFVGWQERLEMESGISKSAMVGGNGGLRFVKVGFYSIGIEKAYRGNGYAKEAVAKIIQMKSASVDRVKAMIVAGNKPSMALARSLDVPVLVKSAYFQHLSPRSAFLSGAFGSPIGAAIYNSHRHNGARAFLHSANGMAIGEILGGLGGLGGGLLAGKLVGSGLSRRLGKMSVDAAEEMIPKATEAGKKMFNSSNLDIMPSVAVGDIKNGLRKVVNDLRGKQDRMERAWRHTGGFLGASGGLLGGASLGSGYGSMQSAKQHNQHVPVDVLKSLLHKSATFVPGFDWLRRKRLHDFERDAGATNAGLIIGSQAGWRVPNDRLANFIAKLRLPNKGKISPRFAESMEKNPALGQAMDMTGEMALREGKALAKGGLAVVGGLGWAMLGHELADRYNQQHMPALLRRDFWRH